MATVFVGDVHNQYRELSKLLNKYDSSDVHFVQVGDLGFDYRPLKILDHEYFRALHGNHDLLAPENPESYWAYPFNLGRYGTFRFNKNEPEFFYLSGAFSIDKVQRYPGHNWFPEEELTEEELEAAIAYYKEIKPDLVVTHDAPTSIVPYVGNAKLLKWYGFDGELKSKTQVALQRMLEYHAPQRWIFGHFHQRESIKVGNTQFECLDMLRNESINENAVYIIEGN
jgi:hypothetical protein